MGRLISIVSGKGGVGKSTVALNTAAALAKHYGRSVALVDMNLTTAHLGGMTGLDPRAVSLSDVLSQKSPLSAALHRHETGMHIVAGPVRSPKLSPAELGRLGAVLRALKRNYDEVILDSGPGLGREAMLSLRYGDELVFVSTPTMPALLDVLRCKQAVSSLKKPAIGLVLNMVAANESQLSASQAESLTDLPVISLIPHDKAVPRSIASETPAIIYDANSPASQAFLRLGAAIAGRQFQPLHEPGFLSGLFGFLAAGWPKRKGSY